MAGKKWDERSYEEGLEDTILEMLARGYDENYIAQALGIPLPEVRQASS